MIRSYLPLFRAVILVGLVSGCASSTQKPDPEAAPLVSLSGNLRVVQLPTTSGSEPRKQAITYLILHHTASGLTSALKTLEGHKVGVHFVVSAEPETRIFRMCPESRTAYHAGHSAWGKLDGLNHSSVGIEIVNLDGNIHPYPKSQIEALLSLSQHIITTHKIRPENVLAHSDIAVGRKIDPGSLFPWEYFAAHGVGAWPDAKEFELARILLKTQRPTADEVRLLLRTYGYRLEDNSEATLKLAIEAFQRHFRGTKVDGLIDDESVAILQALVKKYQSPNRPVASPARSKQT